MATDTRLPPSPRDFITALFTTVFNTQSPPRPDPSTKHSNPPNRNPLSSLPAPQRNLFVTLHCLFPTDLLPALDLLDRRLAEIAQMPGVAEVRSRGVMVGIDLGEHDPELRLGHRVTLEARRRGALVRPLGDVVVLMFPLSITTEELTELLDITAESITAALASLPQAATK